MAVYSGHYAHHSWISFYFDFFLDGTFWLFVFSQKSQRWHFAGDGCRLSTWVDGSTVNTHHPRHPPARGNQFGSFCDKWTEMLTDSIARIMFRDQPTSNASTSKLGLVLCGFFFMGGSHPPTIMYPPRHLRICHVQAHTFSHRDRWWYSEGVLQALQKLAIVSLSTFHLSFEMFLVTKKNLHCVWCHSQSLEILKLICKLLK